MRQTSHVADTAAALTVAEALAEAGGSTTADWSLARPSVTGVIFVVAVSIRSSMKCLGVCAQTVADCPQKLKTGAVVIAFDTWWLTCVLRRRLAWQLSSTLLVRERLSWTHSRCGPTVRRSNQATTAVVRTPPAFRRLMSSTCEHNSTQNQRGVTLLIPVTSRWPYLQALKCPGPAFAGPAFSGTVFFVVRHFQVLHFQRPATKVLLLNIGISFFKCTAITYVVLKHNQGTRPLFNSVAPLFRHARVTMSELILMLHLQYHRQY